MGRRDAAVCLQDGLLGWWYAPPRFSVRRSGREAVSFIERHEKRPFFLYLAFNAVHFPMQAPAETIRRYDTGNGSIRRPQLVCLQVVENRPLVQFRQFGLGCRRPFLVNI